MRILLILLFVTGCATTTDWRNTDCNVLLSDTERSKLCYKVTPEFPKEYNHSYVSGLVAISFDVNAHGVPENILVKNSYPNNIFDQSAINAVSEWVFIPKHENNIPVKDLNVSYLIEFGFDKNPNSTEGWLDNLRFSLQNYICRGDELEKLLPCHQKLNSKFNKCIEDWEVKHFGFHSKNYSTFAKLGDELSQCTTDNWSYKFQ